MFHSFVDRVSLSRSFRLDLGRNGFAPPILALLVGGDMFLVSSRRQALRIVFLQKLNQFLSHDTAQVE